MLLQLQYNIYFLVKDSERDFRVIEIKGHLFTFSGVQAEVDTCTASLRCNYFTCDSAGTAIIFKRLRWRLRRKYFNNFERKPNSNKLEINVFQSNVNE